MLELLYASTRRRTDCSVWDFAGQAANEVTHGQFESQLDQGHCQGDGSHTRPRPSRRHKPSSQRRSATAGIGPDDERAGSAWQASRAARTATVVAEEVAAHSTPADGGVALFVLHEGAEVRVIEAPGASRSRKGAELEKLDTASVCCPPDPSPVDPTLTALEMQAGSPIASVCPSLPEAMMVAMPAARSWSMIGLTGLESQCAVWRPPPRLMFTEAKVALLRFW